MIVLVDLGNSAAKWALATASGEFVETGSIPHGEGQSPLRTLRTSAPAFSNISSIYISSVAGQEITDRWFQALSTDFSSAVHKVAVQRHFNGLTAGYQNLKNLGVDRWLAMLGARSLEPTCRAVMDAGSAITVDYIDPTGCHEGGLIMPGLELMRDALFRRTHRVKVPEASVGTSWRPGTDTDACVSGGISVLALGAVNEALKPLATGDTVFFTGGDGELFRDIAANRLELDVQFDPLLVLRGLSCFAQALHLG